MEFLVNKQQILGMNFVILSATGVIATSCPLLHLKRKFRYFSHFQVLV